MVTIDNEKCIKCGKCIDICPAMVIEQNQDTVALTHGECCILCHQCVAVCPADAITCDVFPLEDFKPLSELKPTAKAVEVENLLISRRSVRMFKDKPVSRELLERLVTIASHAPTGSNAQGVELTIVTNRELIDRVDARIMSLFRNMGRLVDNPLGQVVVKTVAGAKAAEKSSAYMKTLGRFSNAEGSRKPPIFRGAPALILAHAGPGSSSAKDDCVIALTHMMTAAMAHGLGATWIGLLIGAARLDPTLKNEFGIPKKNKIYAAMIMGWPKHEYKRMIPRKTVNTRWME